VRIRLLSDLHLEHAPWIPPEAEQDVVVLAGNIHRGLAGIDWAAQHFACPVIYVPGNHEYDFGDVLTLGEQFAARVLPAKVQVLDDAARVIDGVRFLGTTLWTDFALYGDSGKGIDAAARCVTDFVRIRYAGALLSPLHTLELHRRARQWLENSLAQPFEGKTVVVSHHCPHPNSVAAKFAGSPANPAVASDLSDLILGNPISLWCHGHTHCSLDHLVGGTRIMCNPRGYARDGAPQNEAFNPALVLEI
jgi:3',5'-cyclic AMP phosphodiesterase CpdA